MGAVTFQSVVEMRSRSLFHLPCVLQFVHLLASEKWTVTDSIRMFAMKCFARIGGSQVSEDFAESYMLSFSGFCPQFWLVFYF